MDYARETYSEKIVDEARYLRQAHVEEVSIYGDMVVDMDHGLYRSVDGAGMLRMYTARESGDLKGYAIFFVRANPHYRESLQASLDMIYLEKESRRGFEGVRFLKFCDGELERDGVEVVYHNVTLRRDYGLVLKRMGYEKKEVVYSKRLGV